jgi:hypothetical protein
MVLDQSGPHLADTVLHYKGVVLDSIIEDRLLAETSKVEANRQLVEELRLKKRGLAQLLLQATTASPGKAAPGGGPGPDPGQAGPATHRLRPGSASPDSFSRTGSSRAPKERGASLNT